MATITMPQLGETVTEGTIAQWLKRVGDSVEKYEAFAEISTDKVNAEIPSPVTGVIRELVAREGETVKVGAPIAIIDEVAIATAGAPSSASPASHATADAPVVPSSYGASGSGPGVPAASSNGHAYAAPDRATLTPTAPPAIATAPQSVGDDGRRYSPAVRRLAREHAVALATLHGTGDGGRVTADDVLAAAAPASTPAPASAPMAHAATAVQPSPAPSGRSTYEHPAFGTLVPLSPARRLIARRVSESLATAPHAWTMVEVDVTDLWAWRLAERERFARERGVALTLLPFFAHAVVAALRAFPLMNGRYTDAGIAIAPRVHLGIAIALESNLVVPVVRDADDLSIGGLAVAFGRLVGRARAGTLGPDDLAGGTFTVNNTGANGSVLSKPIINDGQAGIVTMEAVVRRPVVVGDGIAIRHMMNVCLSLDHRVVDGLVANRFLGDLRGRLEAMRPGDQV